MLVQEKKHQSRKLLTIMVLALLTLLSVINLKIVKNPLARFFQHDLGFENFVDTVQINYVSDSFVSKKYFINLNGLFARLTGRRTLNNVVRLNNGMLGQSIQNMDVTALANGIADFSKYLNENENIPFLYIQLPYKESLDGQDYPIGITSCGNKRADDLLTQLSAKEVETLDLRPLLSQTPEMLEQYFYRTDHHWNSDGAFVAFQEILNHLYELFPEGNIDLTYAQADEWERHFINNWSLGSYGKRVGIFFGGTDPLIWYTPKFETEMSCAIPVHSSFFQGDFAEANIRAKYIEEKNYFGSEAYCIYIGGQYPLVQHRNLYAPSPLKVMIIEDSFCRPLQAYLSTVFQEIDTIDPRQWDISGCTIAEYIERTEPDIVLLSIFPNTFRSEYQYFGEKEAVSIKSEGNTYEVVAQKDIEVKAKNDDYNYVEYPMRANTIYRVSFEGVNILEGTLKGVELCLYNKTTKTVLENTIFDLAYCEAANSFSWIFRTPDTEEELQLLFYAGISGSTAGKSTIYRNVVLEKLHNNDS